MSSPTIVSQPHHRFILRYLLLLSLPLFLLTAGSCYLFITKQKNAVRDRLEFFSNSSAQQWDDALASIESQVNILAVDLELNGGILPPVLRQRHYKVWQQLSRPGSVLKGLYYIQQDNKLVNFAHLAIPNTFDASGRTWYQEALKTPGLNIWSPPYLDAIQHTPIATLSRAVLDKQGTLVAVIGIDINLLELSARIGRLLQGGGKLIYFLYDIKSHTIVAHSEPLKNGTQLTDTWLPELKGRSGSLATDNNELIAYYTLANNPNWQVITIYPSNSSFVIHELLPIMMMGLLLSLAMYILVAVIFHQRLENTIGMLVQVVRLLRVTPLGQPIIIPRIPGIEELGDEISMISDQMQAENEKAQRDALTGLYNRRYMDDLLAKLHQSHTPYVLAIIDIDNFKQINDKHGHPIGDAVLRRTATIGHQLLEKQATLCRFGGEEIVVIFEQGDLSQAHQKMELWRQAMEDQEWREPPLTVHFSGGLSEALDAPPAQVLAQADAALYRAKKEGKNRIYLA